MINLKIFDVTLVIVVTVAASIGWGTIGFQSTMAIGLGSGPVSLLNEEEAVETENVTKAGLTNQTTTSRNATEVEFLSIQSAQSGSLTQINETAYTLELNNVANKTIQFSDRPERVAETVSTADFIANWSTGQNSFSADAPNDALIIENTETGELETAGIESFNPVYDTAANTLTYTVMAENGTSIELPNEFGHSILVIDSSDNVVTWDPRGEHANGGIL